MENSFSVEREHCSHKARNGLQCNPCGQLHTINVRPLFTFQMFNQKQTLAEVTRLPLQKQSFYRCKNKLDIPLLVSGWQHHDCLWNFQNVSLKLTKFVGNHSQIISFPISVHCFSVACCITCIYSTTIHFFYCDFSCTETYQTKSSVITIHSRLLVVTSTWGSNLSSIFVSRIISGSGQRPPAASSTAEGRDF